MHAVVTALHAHDVAPALDWAANHGHVLRRSGRTSTLEFTLYKLQFLDIVQRVRCPGQFQRCEASFPSNWAIVRRRAATPQSSLPGFTSGTWTPHMCVPAGRRAPIEMGRLVPLAELHVIHCAHRRVKCSA